MRVIGDGAAESEADVGGLHLAAREPGAAGDLQVTFGLTLGTNVLTTTATGLALTRVRNFDSVVAFEATGYSIRTATRDLAGNWTLVDRRRLVGPHSPPSTPCIRSLSRSTLPARRSTGGACRRSARP